MSTEIYCYRKIENLLDTLDGVDLTADDTTLPISCHNLLLHAGMGGLRAHFKMFGATWSNLPMSFVNLNHIIGERRDSGLILIASRPAMGKTTLALSLATDAAISRKLPAVIFSLEMAVAALVKRLISYVGMVDLTKLCRDGFPDLNNFDRTLIASALMAISNAPIYIDDTPGQHISSICSKCRKLKQENGLGLIIIDYVQLITGTYGLGISWGQEIRKIVQELKALAAELNCPIVVLSQLSRAPENRSDHRPILSDLWFTGDKNIDIGFLPGLLSHSKHTMQESEGIEQDADVVCFLYRDEHYHPDTDKKGITEVITAKYSGGNLGKIELLFIKKYARFESLSM